MTKALGRLAIGGSGRSKRTGFGWPLGTDAYGIEKMQEALVKAYGQTLPSKATNAAHAASKLLLKMHTGIFQ